MSSEAITRNDLKAILDEVLPSVAVDYIVEQGTDGIWTYRKWNSGIAECWGVMSVTVTSWTQWGGTYYSNPYNNYANYPNGLFVASPILTATPKGSSMDAWLISNTAGDASRTDAYYFGRGASVSGSNVKLIYFHAIGRWK